MEKIKKIAKSTIVRAYNNQKRLIEQLHDNSKQIEINKENIDGFTLFIDDYIPKHTVEFYMGGYFYTNSDLIKELNELIKDKEILLDEFSDGLWALKKMNVMQFLKWKAKEGVSIPQFFKAK